MAPPIRGPGIPREAEANLQYDLNSVRGGVFEQIDSIFYIARSDLFPHDKRLDGC